MIDRKKVNPKVINMRKFETPNMKPETKLFLRMIMKISDNFLSYRL